MDLFVELDVREVARLVLEVGHLREGEAEGAARPRLVERVAGVEVLEARVREAVGLEALVALREVVDVDAEVDVDVPAYAAYAAP